MYTCAPLAERSAHALIFQKVHFSPLPPCHWFPRLSKLPQPPTWTNYALPFFSHFFLVCLLAGILPFHYSLCITFPKGLLRFSFADIYISRPWGNWYSFLRPLAHCWPKWWAMMMESCFHILVRVDWGPKVKAKQSKKSRRKERPGGGEEGSA